MMRINSTAKLIVLLSFLMLGTSITGAYFAYQAGSQALKGVNQLTINPSRKLINIPKALTKPTQFKPVDEKTVLSRVYDYTNQKKELKDLQNNKFREKQVQNTIQNRTLKKLPIQVIDHEVKLGVREAFNDGEALLLKVDLENRSTYSVNFLYSSLEIRDNNNSFLGAIVKGLPESLPPKSNIFKGEIRIPNALIRNSKTLSLNLTNHPDRKLKLYINNIPAI